MLLVAAAAVLVAGWELDAAVELELLYEGVELAGDVEAAGATVPWVTKWRRVERFRALATRPWRLTDDLTRPVSCRSSLAIALATVPKSLVGASVSAVVAASLLDRTGVGGRVAVPPS